MSKDKPFLSPETKEEMIKNPTMATRYILDAFDYTFDEMKSINSKIDTKFDAICEKVSEEIKNIPQIICEKGSIWKQITILWGAFAILFVAITGFAIAIIQKDTIKKQIEKPKINISERKVV